MLNVYKYFDNQAELPGRVNALKRFILDDWPPVSEPDDDLDHDREDVLLYKIFGEFGRVPEIEEWMLRRVRLKKQDVITLVWYAREAIKGRWPEAEDFIFTVSDGLAAFEYADRVLAKDKEWTSQPGHGNGRWPDAEYFIMKNPHAAYYYAKYILKRRWPEAEPYIMQDPYDVTHYAKDVIKGRWIEAEPVLMKSSIYWDMYEKEFGLK